ncbi:23S rRNA (guanosine(2251)-2'-O)-methyltransferase RlmB [Anaplasmataceae bacterium AB001_6]|nr:23S rRNA (guanosine(2251)-2'-O)-methyltransferase RlmB [Anaplasmataceae bacterium AB001_6]
MKKIRNIKINKQKNEKVYIYGKHGCINAILNSRRICCNLFINEQKIKEYSSILEICKKKNIRINIKKNIDNIVPRSSNSNFNHQGLLLEALHLKNESLENFHVKQERSLVIILDDITDQHNIGAILRSAACFKIDAVFIKNNIFYDNGTVSKVSSGALDIVKIIEITNIKRSINHLKSIGYSVYAMDSMGQNINNFSFNNKAALVLGSEGKGIKNSVLEYCDYRLTIPIFSCDKNNLDSLNVSNAATVGMYEFCRQEKL